MRRPLPRRGRAAAAVAAALILSLLGGCVSFSYVPPVGPAYTYHDAGQYLVQSLSQDGREYSRLELEQAGLGDMGLLLREDGSGEICYGGGRSESLSWRDGRLDIGGAVADYRLEGTELTLDLGGGTVLVMARQRLDKAEREEKTEEPAEQEPAGEPLAAAELGAYSVALLGAQWGEGDEAALWVYYAFTNGGTAAVSAWEALRIEARQDGRLLSAAGTEAGETGNELLSVLPGAEVWCVCGFAVDPEGGPVSLRIEPYAQQKEEAALEAVLELQQLPGAPGPWEPAAEPAGLTEGLEEEGDLGQAHVRILEGQCQEGSDGGQVLTVRLQYTNESSQAACLADAVVWRAYQDGVELQEGWTAEEPAGSGGRFALVQPGQTAEVSVCFRLRSDSPVELELTDGQRQRLGHLFPVVEGE